MKSLINKFIDKKFIKMGWDKTEDSPHYVRYEKNIHEYNYKHIITIAYKNSGEHIIQSYSDDETNNLFSYAVGLSFKEALLSTLKLKILFG